ncbi:MAG: hypothetical protein J6O41_04415, partial [Clostridia bacterium]|nr:hypothetical protein [Clostridia bacterium]
CSNGDKVVEGLNICVSNCNELTDRRYFFYESDGSSDTYSTYDKCVLYCPNEKPFVDGDKCVPYCPEDKIFFIDSVINPYKICLNDCPTEYPYYFITQNAIDSSKNDYHCKADCLGYFVPNINPLINANQCLNSCPDINYPIYKYKLVYEENDKTIKKCYEECPPEYKYHFDLNDNPSYNDCYKACPEEKKAPYHLQGETICRKLSELTSGFLLYDIKEWTDSMIRCPNNYTLYSQTEDAVELIICLKECNFKYYDEPNDEYYLYGYLTPYNTCVRDCTSSPLSTGKNMINDELNKKCICENLFYIEEANFQITCYPNTITECKDTTNPQSPIPLHGSKQCLKTCADDRILTPSEDDCYEKGTPCSSMESYSYTKLITKSDGQKKCECMFKYYYDGTKKVCLSENSVCPLDKNMLIPDIMECVASCPSLPTKNYPYKFKNFCLNHCPLGSTFDSVNNECKCDNKFWYETSPGNYECLEGNCLSDYPVYIEPTKQCLKSCKESFYYKYLYDNK